MISLAIHGGAGTIEPELLTPERKEQYEAGLKAALHAGYSILESGGTSLDAVSAAIQSLEDNTLFNAGKGAVFNHIGKNELDASIMCGKTLMAGAVSGLKHIKNPIALAKAVMEKSEHVFLYGEGAEEFAQAQHFELVDPSYFYDEFRYQQWQNALKEGVITLDHVDEKKFGTVGAVALDHAGNLAAGTSTGGMTNKKFGRIGDTPMIGAGTYANNQNCAISCTGHGEFFIRAVVAHDIACLMEYKGYSLKQACDEVVMNKLVKLGGEGGLIAIDVQGNIELPFNSSGMYRGMKSDNGVEFIGIFR